MSDFDVMKDLDNLSELMERVDERYKPIVQAKINYRLQKIYESRTEQVVDKSKPYIPERFCR